MNRRRITRFRSRPQAHRLDRFQGIISLLATVAVGAAATWGLWSWVSMKQDALRASWVQRVEPFGRMTFQAFVSRPRVPERILTGREPEVTRMLEEAPFAIALARREDPSQLWVREGDHLIPAVASNPEHDRCAAWVREGLGKQASTWNPAGISPDPMAWRNHLVLLGPQWIVINRWEPGSPQLDWALTRIFRDHVPLRFALQGPHPPPLFHDTPWQTHGSRVRFAALRTNMDNNLFPAPLVFTLLPSREDEARYQRDMRWTWGMAGLAALTGVGLVVATALSRLRDRRRIALDADRLASLTHSLKTPLAILKMRCDTLRLGRVPAARAELELLRISGEVDDLTHLIESGLHAIRGIAAPAAPLQALETGHLAEQVEEFQDLLDPQRRPLEVNLQPARLRVSPISLHGALQTLVENAVCHGNGPVSIQGQVRGRAYRLQVIDAGSGLERFQLAALGEPFRRFRPAGQEGFPHPGQGLGLSLLFQIARREGWGLEIFSAPERGFIATMDLHLAQE